MLNFNIPIGKNGDYTTKPVQGRTVCLLPLTSLRNELQDKYVRSNGTDRRNLSLLIDETTVGVERFDRRAIA